MIPRHGGGPRWLAAAAAWPRGAPPAPGWPQSRGHPIAATMADPVRRGGGATARRRADPTRLAAPHTTTYRAVPGSCMPAPRNTRELPTNAANDTCEHTSVHQPISHAPGHERHNRHTQRHKPSGGGRGGRCCGATRQTALGLAAAGQSADETAVRAPEASRLSVMHVCAQTHTCVCVRAYMPRSHNNAGVSACVCAHTRTRTHTNAHAAVLTHVLT